MRSWWWVEVPPETCTAVSRYKLTVKSCILLDIYWNIFRMHGPIKVKSTKNGDYATKKSVQNEILELSETLWSFCKFCIYNDVRAHIFQEMAALAMVTSRRSTQLLSWLTRRDLKALYVAVPLNVSTIPHTEWESWLIYSMFTMDTSRSNYQPATLIAFQIRVSKFPF